MNYKVVKYTQRKKHVCPLETYEPQNRIRLNKEHAVPWIVETGNILSALGGLIGFWASSGLMIVKSFFGVREKIKRLSFGRRVVEIGIKKK